MSSFDTKARNRKTGEVVNVFCHDDFFGHHEYGYSINGHYMNEIDFRRQYEVLPTPATEKKE